jgi:predicted kinase
MSINIIANGNRKREPKVIATRGLPASGKSAAAVAWVAADPEWRVRINRDDLRDMGHGRRLGTPAQEAIVTGLQHSGARTALSHGTSVIIDDTNLPEASIQALAKIADELGAEFEVWDFRGVPVQVCIGRDAMRAGADQVGEEVIWAMYDKHIANAKPDTIPVTIRAMVNG